MAANKFTATGNMPVGAVSPLKTEEIAEAINQLEGALGMLSCLEEVGGPCMDFTGVELKRHVEQMAAAAGGIFHLVHRAQAILIEAPAIEVEAGHA